MGGLLKRNPGTCPKSIPEASIESLPPPKKIITELNKPSAQGTTKDN